MPKLQNLVRTLLVAFVALLGLFGPLVAPVGAVAIVAQTAPNTTPQAPGIVFFVLLAAIFVAVLAFSFRAFQDANK